MNGWMVRGESDRMLLVGRRDNLGARRGRMDGCMPGESDRMLLIGRRDNLGARPGPNGPMDDAGGTNQTGRFFLLDVGITLARGVDQWTGAGEIGCFFIGRRDNLVPRHGRMDGWVLRGEMECIFLLDAGL